MSRLSATRLRFDVPLGATIGSAALRHARRAGVVLRLEDDAGRAGLGEASPLPGYSDDTLDEAAAELRSLATTGSLEACDSIEAIAALVETSGLRTPSARCALESALLDLAARRQSRGVHALLSARARASVPLNALVTLEDEAHALIAARAAVGRGHRAIKAKVGAPGRFEHELRVLAALRDQLGHEIEIRLDANGAWSVDEARDRLDALVPLAPAFVEQPVPAADLARLVDAPLPLAADESTRLPGLLDECLAAGIVAVVVLKPMVLGGLLPALALARKAQGAGARCVVTHLFGGPVAHAGAVELALALDHEPLACGLAPHPVVLAMGLPDQLAAEPHVARASRLHGLGVGAASQDEAP